MCRASFNIYAVRTLFQSALVQLRAVFVADRPGSIVWRKHVYKVSETGGSPGDWEFCVGEMGDQFGVTRRVTR